MAFCSTCDWTGTPIKSSQFCYENGLEWLHEDDDFDCCPECGTRAKAGAICGECGHEGPEDDFWRSGFTVEDDLPSKVVDYPGCPECKSTRKIYLPHSGRGAVTRITYLV